MIPTNFLAILVAAIAAFIIGFLAHGPVSGKLWMKLANVHATGNEKFSDMIPKLIWNFVINIFSAYILSFVFIYISTSSYASGSLITNGIIAGLLLWVITSLATVIDVIWMGKSLKLWLFEVVASLAVFIAMGAIIAAI